MMLRYNRFRQDLVSEREKAIQVCIIIIIIIIIIIQHYSTSFNIIILLILIILALHILVLVIVFVIVFVIDRNRLGVKGVRDSRGKPSNSVLELPIRKV